MTNLNQLKNNLSVIIFDFDETLYYSPNALKCYIKFILKAILDLSNYNKKQALAIMKEHGFTQKGENRVSFGANCEKFGISRNKWEEYKKEHFFEIDYENAQIVNNDLLRKLSSKKTLIIVSNEIYENILYKAKKLGINLSFFSNIYAPKKEDKRGIDKKTVYTNILKEYDLSPSSVMVIGDRYKVDIKPFEEIGGQGIQISNTKEIENIISDLL